MKYFFANWKMYLDLKQSLAFAEDISNLEFDNSKVGVSVFPNQITLCEVSEKLKGGGIYFGTQNVDWENSGAYSGATSVHMFKEIGCDFALVGHSERREVFGETNEDVRRKVEACLGGGIIPVLCIGETKEEKDSGKRNEILMEQLRSALEGLDKSNTKIMVAYEPIWAIGTGEACEPLEAKEVHLWIKEEYKKYFSNKDVEILYGGSVDAQNVLSYLSIDSISGVLVGSASTKIESFSAILKIVENL
ncbi:MAG: triose-phosphate isomerase [Candidatus Magasanikbacteria bacterium]|nr:triose-phosphate isomerase [Candidatus Magasanikbacteria bacterium]